MNATTWATHPSGYDSLNVGRYTIIVFTGSPAKDLDDGHQVCECYIPTTDRLLPDGAMIVGRRRLETKDRMEAREAALLISLNAIADYDTWNRR